MVKPKTLFLSVFTFRLQEMMISLQATLGPSGFTLSFELLINHSHPLSFFFFPKASDISQSNKHQNFSLRSIISLIIHKYLLLQAASGFSSNISHPGLSLGDVLETAPMLSQRLSLPKSVKVSSLPAG